METLGCRIEECQHPRRYKQSQLCANHHKRLRAGDPDWSRPVTTPVPELKKCSISGCGKPAHRRTWCSMHYARHLKGADMGAPPQRYVSTDGRCTIEGCGRPHQAKGLCGAHYARVQKVGFDPQAPVRTFDPERGCRIPGCEERHSCHGLCKGHSIGYASYNLTDEQIVRRDTGSCDICGKTETRRLAVDHDHTCCPSKMFSCGKCVRGFLCTNCNQALGQFRDSTDLLRKAAMYLEDFKGVTEPVVR